MNNKVYIIEYRFWSAIDSQWISKISQEGYSTYEEARKFCEQHAGNNGVTKTPMYFLSTNNGLSVFEEFYIHEVTVK